MNSSKRETIAPKGDKRYIRRDEEGRGSRSPTMLAVRCRRTSRRTAKNVSKAGQGDKGDRAHG